MSENQKKTARTFQCRDALWEKFEEMARELESSVDYLVNDAMKQYARQRGYAPAAAASSVAASTAPPAPTSSPRASSPKPAPLPPVTAALPPMPSRAPAAPPRSPVPSLAGHPEIRAAAPPPPPAPSHGIAMPGPPTVPLTPSRVPPPPPHGSGLSAAARPAAPPPPRPARSPQAPTLTVYYEGTAYPVNKDKFVIGRGKQVADLTIRDPNISRQHAVVEFSNGSFWMVDLNSTNGVEFNGQRVNRRQIHNGEVYRICSHELLMSLS